MTNKEMTNLFECMRRLFCLNDMQLAYDAQAWKNAVRLWHGVFQNDDFSHVWAAVRMYIRNGGKYWPYPGEIADLMPSCSYCDDDSLRRLTYHTRAQEKIDAKRYERDHMLNPWRC